MAENYMEIVARLLGVELGEEFKIDNDGLHYKYKTEKDNGLVFWSEGCQEWTGSGMISALLLGKAKIVKLPKQIITDSEKRYLSSVIKPFKDRIRCIIKSRNFPDEYLRIHLERYDYDDKKNHDIIYLPCFEVGTMYKGMELGKGYTLKELGL